MDLEDIGLQLHEQGIVAGTPIHPQQFQLAEVCIAAHCIQHLPRLHVHASHHCAIMGANPEPNM